MSVRVEHVRADAVTSPKIKAGGVAGAGVTVALLILAAFLQAVGPEHLEGLGVWAGPVGAALGVGAALAAGYAKFDPLRALGARAEARHPGSVEVLDRDDASLPLPEDVARAEADAHVEPPRTAKLWHAAGESSPPA